MNQINKILLCGLLLCLLGAAGKGYGQEVEPGEVVWNYIGRSAKNPVLDDKGRIFTGDMMRWVICLNQIKGVQNWEVSNLPVFSASGGPHVGMSLGGNRYLLNHDGSDGIGYCIDVAHLKRYRPV